MVTYKKGNLLTSGCNIIGHVVNCQGAMNSGIAKQIRAAWPQHYQDYRAVYEEYGSDKVFGSAVFTSIRPNQVIAGLFSQFDYRRASDPPDAVFFDHEAFRNGCDLIKKFIHEYPELEGCRIGFPDHIGCGLAGGDWDYTRGIIEGEFVGPEWNVEVWKYEG